jgi:hypothetical protein
MAAKKGVERGFGVDTEVTVTCCAVFGDPAVAESFRLEILQALEARKASLPVNFVPSVDVQRTDRIDVFEKASKPKAAKAMPKTADPR